MWIQYWGASSLESTSLGWGQEWKTRQEELWVLPALINSDNVSIFHLFYSLLPQKSAFQDFSGILQGFARRWQQERVLTVCIQGTTGCPKLGSWNRPHQHLQPWRSSSMSCRSIWLQITASEFWDHVCWIQPFQPVFAPQINFWVIKNQQIVFQKIVFFRLLSLFAQGYWPLLKNRTYN